MKKSVRFIKSYLNFGRIVPNKLCVLYIVSKHADIITILNLMNGKIRIPIKYDQIIK